MMQRFPSLLTPDRPAERLARWDLWAMAGIYLLAFALRWSLRAIQPYTAEAIHFVVARGLWHTVTNVGAIWPGSPTEDASWFFWQRPFLTLPFWPAAIQSFEVYRVMHILLASAVPLLGAWLLRSLGTARPYAYGAAVVLAVHPALLPWGVIVLPDSTVLVLTLAGLLAAHHGRPWLTAGLLLSAGWVKEVAFVTPLTLFVLACWRDADGTPARFWPVRAGPFARLMLPVAGLCFLPLWVSLQVPGVLFPGFRPGGDDGSMYESLWLLVWLAPIPLLGLLRPQTRRFTLVALAWPAFFLVYHYGMNKAIESWYNVIPGSLTVLAAAAALSGCAQTASSPQRRLYPAVALVMALLVGIQVAAPDTAALNQAIVTPFSGRGHWNLDQAMKAERSREQDLARVMTIPGPAERREWIALDVDWSLAMYPIGWQAERIDKVYSATTDLDVSVMTWWANAIENQTQVTLVFAHDDIAINVSTRAAYVDCSTVVGHYALIQPSRGCHGRASSLWWHYQEARQAQAH